VRFLIAGRIQKRAKRSHVDFGRSIFSSKLITDCKQYNWRKICGKILPNVKLIMLVPMKIGPQKKTAKLLCKFLKNNFRSKI